MFWIAQALGVCICILSSASLFSKNKPQYLAEQFGVNVLYGVQYLLLGAYSGAISNLLSLAKYIVFYINAKRDRKNPPWQMWLFCVLSVVMGAAAIDGWHTLIPIVTAVLFTVAIWQDNPLTLRAVVMVCSGLWVVFNLYVGAYVSAVYSFVELCVAAVTLWRLRKKRESV